MKLKSLFLLKIRQRWFYRSLCCLLICLFKFDGWIKRISHLGQANGLSPVCVLMWKLKALGQANLASQKLHAKGFSPVCFLMWTKSIFFFKNFLLHWLQVWGLSFIWRDFVCLFSSDLDTHVFPQCSQSTARNLVWTSFVCLPNWPLSLNDLLQKSQWKDFNPKCMAWCRFKTAVSVQSKEQAEHLKGLSPVCNRIWLSRPFLYL